MLWEERALFDIFRNKLNKANEPKPEIHIKCGYCGDNISTKGKKNKTAGHATNSQVSIMSMRCRGCQKPLTRCAVCSLYMNFDPPKSAILNENGKKFIELEKLFYNENIFKDKIGHAFVFCLMCNHGGHTMHLYEWFKYII